MRQKPVFLNLFQIKFPITAIVSILHRVSGAFFFFLIPVFLWALSNSMHSAKSFEYLRECLTSSYSKATVWLVLSGILYHMIAGVRHLLMDVGFAEQLKYARISSYLVIVLSVIGTVYLGYMLW